MPGTNHTVPQSKVPTEGNVKEWCNDCHCREKCCDSPDRTRPLIFLLWELNHIRLLFHCRMMSWWPITVTRILVLEIPRHRRSSLITWLKTFCLCSKASVYFSAMLHLKKQQQQTRQSETLIMCYSATGYFIDETFELQLYSLKLMLLCARRDHWGCGSPS